MTRPTEAEAAALLVLGLHAMRSQPVEVRARLRTELRPDLVDLDLVDGNWFVRVAGRVLVSIRDSELRTAMKLADAFAGDPVH